MSIAPRSVAPRSAPPRGVRTDTVPRRRARRLANGEWRRGWIVCALRLLPPLLAPSSSAPTRPVLTGRRGRPAAVLWPGWMHLQRSMRDAARGGSGTGSCRQRHGPSSRAGQTSGGASVSTRGARLERTPTLGRPSPLSASGRLAARTAPWHSRCSMPRRLRDARAHPEGRACCAPESCDAPDSAGDGVPTSFEPTIAADRERSNVVKGLLTGGVGHTVGEVLHRHWPGVQLRPVAQAGVQQATCPSKTVAGCIMHPDRSHDGVRATDLKQISYTLKEEDWESAREFAAAECKRSPAYNLFTQQLHDVRGAGRPSRRCGATSEHADGHPQPEHDPPRGLLPRVADRQATFNQQEVDRVNARLNARLNPGAATRRRRAASEGPGRPAAALRRHDHRPGALRSRGRRGTLRRRAHPRRRAAASRSRRCCGPRRPPSASRRSSCARWRTLRAGCSWPAHRRPTSGSCRWRRTASRDRRGVRCAAPTAGRRWAPGSRPRRTAAPGPRCRARRSGRARRADPPPTSASPPAASSARSSSTLAGQPLASDSVAAVGAQPHPRSVAATAVLDGVQACAPPALGRLAPRASSSRPPGRGAGARPARRRRAGWAPARACR